MKKIIQIVSPILACLTIGYSTQIQAYTHAVFMGSIQFPKTITDLPMMRIYCAGNKIKCETNEPGKRITFALPEDKRRTIFWLIITEKFLFASEQNTIKYL